MKAPQRLADGDATHSSALGALVKAARTDLPDEARLQSVGTALHARLLDAAMTAGHASPWAGAPVGAAAAGAAAGTVGGMGAALKYGAGVAAALLVTGGAVWVGAGGHWTVGQKPARPTPSEVARRPDTLSAPEVGGRPTAPAKAQERGAALLPAEPATAPARPLAPPASLGAPSAGSVAVPNGSGGGTAPASSTPDLPAAAPSEIDLLRLAEEHLRTDPAAALALADQHAARFPAGMLAQESEVIAVEALVQLGRKDEARERAAHLLRSAPTTAHRRRMEALVGALSGADVHNP